MRTRPSVFLVVCALLAQACSSAPAAPPAATSAPAAPAATSAPAAAPKPTTAPAAAPASPITLNVWVRNYTLNMESPFMTAKAAFEAKHPGVTVSLVGAPYD